MTGVAQVAFKGKANGSLVEVQREGRRQLADRPGVEGRRSGSTAGRPRSPTTRRRRRARTSDPTRRTSPTAIKEQAAAIIKLEGPYNPGLTVGDDPGRPADVSGSGLDPDISEAAALLQVPRIAAVRGLTEDAVRQLVEDHLQGRELGFLGQPRVNVWSSTSRWSSSGRSDRRGRPRSDGRRAGSRAGGRATRPCTSHVPRATVRRSSCWPLGYPVSQRAAGVRHASDRRGVRGASSSLDARIVAAAEELCRHVGCERTTSRSWRPGAMSVASGRSSPAYPPRRREVALAAFVAPVPPVNALDEMWAALREAPAAPLQKASRRTDARGSVGTVA